MPFPSLKHIMDTASRALRYAARTSSAVIMDMVPLDPYSDIAPYPFITLYCARLVSWYVIICDTEIPPSPAMLSNSDCLSADSGSA